MNRPHACLIRLSIVAGCIVQGAACIVNAAPPTGAVIGAHWVQTLAEDFDGPTLDTSIWSARDFDGRPNGNNGVTWGWDPDNISIQNGNLVIATTADGDGTYSSGNVWTKDKWYQTYGYFEARIKLPPTVSGSQAAFWMTAQDNGHFTVGDDGRDGAEIDIVETPDSSEHYRTGLHWDGYGSDHQSAGAQHSAPGIHTGYHDFGLYWDANTLKYYYDGQLKRTYTGVGVPRVAEVLQASVGILDWVDGDITTATLPVETRFDHIYAWQLLADDSVVVVDDASDAITYIGSAWQDQGNAQDHAGTMMQSGAAGDAVELTFEGTAVDVFVRFGLFGGIIDVYLDGQLVADDIDTYASAATYQQLLYSVDGLAAGEHTVRLEVTGDKNPSSVSTLLMFDAIQYVPIPEPASAALLGLGGLMIAHRRK